MAVTAGQADPGLTGWEQFWIVIGGSLVAAAVLAGVHWLWESHRCAILEFQCGEGYDFERRVGNTDRAVAPAVEEHRPMGAFAKFMVVAEIRGKSGAHNVVVRLRDIVPPPPHTSKPVELRWLDSTEENDIRPNGEKRLFLQLVIFYEMGDGTKGWRTTPTVFDHGDTLEFTLEILVGGKRRSLERFRIDNKWASARIDALPADPWPPAGLEYPKVERA